jgi:predicted anti-sigma-YlaC factor YlaD
MKRQPDCTIKEESLLLFHYRELAPKERLALTEHLRQCPACRQRLAELQNSLASLPRPTLELSAAEVGWLSARIAARTRPAPRPRFWLWSGAVATAALVVSLAAWPPTGPDSRLGVMGRTSGEIGMVEDPELLQNMDLLQNLDLLQELKQVG